MAQRHGRWVSAAHSQLHPGDMSPLPYCLFPLAIRQLRSHPRHGVAATQECAAPGLRFRRALKVIPVMPAPAGTCLGVAPASCHFASLASSWEGTGEAASEPAGQQRPHWHSQQASPVQMLG